MGQTLPTFLLGVAVISLSGILMPGPVTAATIALSRDRRWAGLGVGAGHCLLELPIVALLFWGSESVLREPLFQRALGVAGGAVLGWMGWSMLRGGSRTPAGGTAEEKEGGNPARGPLRAGFLTSLANPYIFLWWATVGAGMAAQGERFGPAGFAALAAVHWSCDLGWGAAVGLSSHGILGKASPRVQTAVFAVCGLALMGFGARFLWTGLF